MSKAIISETDTPAFAITAEEEVQQIKGQSWFDVEEKYRERTGRKSLTRIIFTSLVVASETHEAQSCMISSMHDFFTEFNEKSPDISDMRDDTVDRVYGGVVLLSDSGYGNDSKAGDEELLVAALGFLETDCPSSAHECLSGLKARKSSLGLSSIRILLVSDDCPCHEFGPFGIYIASPPTESCVDVEKEGPSIVFGDIMKKLCKQSLAFPSEAKDHGSLSNVKVLLGSQRKAVPSAARAQSCAERDAYPTLEEYLDVYHSPIYLELDSENMSPLLPVIDWKKVENIVSSFLGKEEQEQDSTCN